MKTTTTQKRQGKPKMPKAYKAPLRSRTDILAYLEGIGGYAGHHEKTCLSWNVKTYHARMELDRLQDSLAESLNAEHFDILTNHADEVQEWVDENRDGTLARLAEFSLGNLAESVHDTDAYTMLWDGTAVPVELGFFGRSSGYLGIKAFDGYAMDFSSDDIASELNDWPYERLRLLYRYAVQCSADFTPKKASEALEYQFGFDLACNCGEFEAFLDEIAERELTGIRGEGI